MILGALGVFSGFFFVVVVFGSFILEFFSSNEEPGGVEQTYKY